MYFLFCCRQNIGAGRWEVTMFSTKWYTQYFPICTQTIKNNVTSSWWIIWIFQFNSFAVTVTVTHNYTHIYSIPQSTSRCTREEKKGKVYQQHRIKCFVDCAWFPANLMGDSTLGNVFFTCWQVKHQQP